MRASGLTNNDVKQICDVLRADPANPTVQNKSLKVLDLSYNKFSGEALQHFDAVLQTNRSLEYLGFAKNKLRSDHVEPLLK